MGFSLLPSFSRDLATFALRLLINYQGIIFSLTEHFTGMLKRPQVFLHTDIPSFGNGTQEFLACVIFRSDVTIQHGRRRLPKNLKRQAPVDANGRIKAGACALN